MSISNSGRGPRRNSAQDKAVGGYPAGFTVGFAAGVIVEAALLFVVTIFSVL